WISLGRSDPRWRSYPEFSRPQVGRWQTCLGRVLPSNWRHRVLRPDHGFSYLPASGAKRDAAKIRLSEAAPAEFLLLDKVRRLYPATGASRMTFFRPRQERTWSCAADMYV